MTIRRPFCVAVLDVTSAARTAAVDYADLAPAGGNAVQVSCGGAYAM